jgi:hypothetical protein
MKRIAILGAVAVGLMAPASAQAKNFQQKGFVKGDRAATVKLRVAVENGHPTKVAGFRAINVRARCGKDRVRITLRAVTPIRVKDDHTFKARLADDEGGVLHITGKVKDGGRKTKGRLWTNEFESGKKTCRVPQQRWKTSVENR